MSVADFVIILIITLILSLLFVYLLGVRGPWGSFWTFFLIMVFGVWAAGFWLSPAGPLLYGAPWVSFLAAALVLALLLAAVGTPAAINPNKESNSGNDAGPDTGTKVGAVFWILLTIFVIAVMIGTLF